MAIIPSNPIIEWRGTKAQANTIEAPAAGVIGYLTDTSQLIVFNSSVAGDYQMLPDNYLNSLAPDISNSDKQEIQKKLGIAAGLRIGDYVITDDVRVQTGRLTADGSGPYPAATYPDMPGFFSANPDKVVSTQEEWIAGNKQKWLFDGTQFWTPLRDANKVIVSTAANDVPASEAQLAQFLTWMQNSVSIVSIENYTNYVDQWGNTCGTFRRETYINSETDIVADGLPNNGWYHKDRSGHVVQGGRPLNNGVITFPIPMSNTSYYYSTQPDSGEGNAGSSLSIKVSNKTTLGWTAYCRTGGSGSSSIPYCFEVRGRPAS
jgi:hypothetical protein